MRRCIDFSVLRDLTDQDLKDIGVVLGDRRTILRAISELAGAAAATPQVHAGATVLERSDPQAKPWRGLDILNAAQHAITADQE